ncbi:hypothetical protein BD410DRAFT_808852 [Rickenella mellea]|uniref:Transferase-domain-containing protein n=1 Tax=Rickenella mellea TaxID=50990 RepID=A0A4Y7PJY1_9AGAM|nr:hypothetical protein BD410DRAFT_808852 [Rickenella mellea]
MTEVSKRYLIYPTVPTDLDGQSSIIFPPTDTLALSFVLEFVWVLPTFIDITRHNEALSKTLQKFPPVAGRLRKLPDTDRAKGSIYIQLTNSAIPVSVVENYDGTRVNLDNAIVPSTAEWTDSFPGNEILEKDEPLLRFRFTKINKTGQMAYGLAWSHALGDGFILNLFLQYISHFYRGLDASSLPRPSFEKVFFPAPPSDTSAAKRFLPLMKHIRDAKPMQELVAATMQSQESTKPLNFVFSVPQMELLYKRAIAAAPEPSRAMFSKIDVLIAYLVFVYNTVLAEVHPDSEGIDTVVTTIEYRGNPSFAPTAMFGNAAITFTCPSFHAPSPLSKDAGARQRLQYFGRSIVAIAHSIRAGIIQTRSPAFLGQYLLYHNELCRRSYQQGLYQYILPATPREITFNSSYKVPWRTAVDFYEPGSKHAGGRMTTFHTNAILERYIRIFPANPIPIFDKDGKLLNCDMSFDGGVEVAFRLDSSMADLFKGKVELDMTSGFGYSFANL